MIKSDNYINIQGWMITELNLKGNDLLVYATIYGFTQDEKSRFTGSLQYLADWCNGTKQGVQKNLKNLIERGLVEKFEKEINGIKFCEYSCIPHNRVAWGIQQSCINNTSNTKENKKSIISKDINTVKKSDSFLGSVKKPKQKQSLYSKAVGLINDFSDNQKIRDSLIDFLNLQLEIYKEQEKTFYINTFKNRLNKLRNEFSESDWLEVINYAVSRGWQNFYPIPTKNNFNTDGENESYYDDDYLEQQENWQREMARNGKETKF